MRRAGHARTADFVAGQSGLVPEERGGGGSSSGGGGSMGPGNTPMIRNEWISQGGVNLTVRFDPAARKVWIQDEGNRAE